MPNSSERKLGRIRTFGFKKDKYGYRYGYIDGEFDERYFVHENALECSPYHIYTGCIVTYEVERAINNDLNQVSDKKYSCAKNIQIFESTIDEELLIHCLSRQERYRKSFLLDYLPYKLDAIKLAIETTSKLEGIDKKQIVHYLTELCICPRSGLLATSCNVEASLKLYLLCEILNDCLLTDEPTLRLEIEIVLKSANRTAISFFWRHKSVRRQLAYQSFLWSFAPGDPKLDVILKALQDYSSYDGLIVQEICTALKSSSPQATAKFWSSPTVAKYALKHRTLLNLAPFDLRLELLHQLLKNGCDIDGELQSEIQIALHGAQPSVVKQFWSDLNIETRISYREFLWKLAPATLRLKILYQLLQDGVQADKILEGEIQIALQDAEPQEKQQFWSCPDVQKSLIYKGFLWNLTPINLRLNLLCQIISTSSTDESSLKAEVWFALQNATEQEKQEFWSHSGVQERIVYRGFLWNLTPIKLRLKLLCRAITDDLIDNDTLENEIRPALRDATQQEAHHFWSSPEVQKEIVFGGFLWKLAPRIVQEKLLRGKYQAFLMALEQFLQSFQAYPYLKAIKTEPCEVYSKLAPQDYELANLWLKAESTSKLDYAQAKMLSARAAEKCVQNFYKALGHHVRDVAVEQLEFTDSLCYQCDLLIDDSIAVDVKNARQSFSNRRRYVELCVPKFKRVHRHEVVVAGVFSPYLKLQEIQASANIKKEPILFLGEIQKSEIEALEKHFSKQFLSITIPRTSKDNYLPPWLFDYSKRFYCNQIKATDQFKQTLSNFEAIDIPTSKEIEFLSINPIFAYLSTQIEIPDCWMNSLDRWEQSFIRQLTGADSRVTLPFLFLAIFSHFIEMLQNEEEAYSPKKYLDLLYCKSDVAVGHFRPLGIYDPLEIIQELCETLTLLWNRRRTERLTEFNRFKFDGKGLLRGQRESSSRLTTILAYCGGWVTSSGKCGFAPLVLGEDETCQSCQRLICPSCGYCSEDEEGNYCGHYERRQSQNHPASNRRAYSESRSHIDLSDELPF